MNMLSTIKSIQHSQASNNNNQYMSKAFAQRGFTYYPSKNKQVQASFSVESFKIQKQQLTLDCFILKLDKQLFMCAGYLNGKLVQEKEVKFQADMPHSFISIFEAIKKKNDEKLFRFDLALQKVRGVCEKTELKIKNYQNFSQQIKATLEYINIKNLEKLAYEKIVADSQRIREQRAQIQNKNKQLVDALLAIQAKKQLLQTSLHSFDSENQYLSNTAERIDEQINIVKSNFVELNPSNINDATFKNYLKAQIQIKELQIKKKSLEI